eukprot:TRINITY_DN1063_c1_g1_i1.p1 TRINITY_DN1063_c1_g1~~TRINITY_DN1063_c1_g1_i1.p1  ORF type:complete len:534 (+),score=103.55 TRINITY_DN1063_c1_g1_i1:229-1602(+)
MSGPVYKLYQMPFGISVRSLERIYSAPTFQMLGVATHVLCPGGQQCAKTKTALNFVIDLDSKTFLAISEHDSDTPLEAAPQFELQGVQSVNAAFPAAWLMPHWQLGYYLAFLDIQHVDNDEGKLVPEIIPLASYTSEFEYFGGVMAPHRGLAFFIERDTDLDFNFGIANLKNLSSITIQYTPISNAGVGFSGAENLLTDFDEDYLYVIDSIHGFIYYYPIDDLPAALDAPLNPNTTYAIPQTEGFMVGNINDIADPDHIYSINEYDPTPDNPYDLSIFRILRMPAMGKNEDLSKYQLIEFNASGPILCYAFNARTRHLYLGTGHNRVVKININFDNEGSGGYEGGMNLYDRPPSSIPDPSTWYGGAMSSMNIDQDKNIMYTTTEWWGYLFEIDLDRFCPDDKGSCSIAPEDKKGLSGAQKALIGILVSVSALIIAIVAFALWRKYKSPRNRYAEVRM